MPMRSQKNVIFDHDGGIDDLLSLILLLSMPHIRVVGVCITPADCYPDDALISTLKILTLTGNSHVPVTVGTLAGPNPFPPDWRAQPKICHALPAMLRVNEVTDNHLSMPAQQWIHDTLLASEEPVTVLMTGPATNLAWALTQLPPQKHTVIEEVIWMGGAIDVKGNVAMHDHNGTAEWNAYWDPQATATLVKADVNLCLVPLDATNALPVNRAFLMQLAQSEAPVAELAGQFWAATVTAIPAYEFTYFLWDILSTAVLGLPESAMQFTQASVEVAVTTPNAGQIYRSDEAGSATIRWLHNVDADVVRAYVVSQFNHKFDDFSPANC